MSTAQVIPFKKPPQSKQGAGGNMYSDRFVQGHVMSSRLYRKEVWPFLSDAARNVYTELENRINGHLKETDFVSYSQLQGDPELEGARIMGRTSVSNALKELVKRGVVSVVSTGKKGMKSYRINEVSLINQSTNKTSNVTVPVQQQDRNSNVTVPVTSNVTGHTIDTSLDSLENKKKNLPVDNSETEMFGDSVKYHGDNSNPYSLRELASEYPIQTDLQTQAKNLNSELTDEFIFAELKNFAQWSTSRDKTTAQGWMNYWIYRIQKLSKPKSKATNKLKSAPGTKKLSDSQVDMFSKKLCNHHDFADMYSNVGETQKQFEIRVSKNLREPKQVAAWASYLHDVGFIGRMENFV